MLVCTGRLMQNVVLMTYGQQTPSIACAAAQFDQGFHCPRTESLDTTECITEDKCDYEIMHTYMLVGINISLRGPKKVLFCC